MKKIVMEPNMKECTLENAIEPITKDVNGYLTKSILNIKDLRYNKRTFEEIGRRK